MNGPIRGGRAALPSVHETGKGPCCAYLTWIFLLAITEMAAMKRSVAMLTPANR